jgi:flagellar basal-body rod protein FlgB
MFNNIEMMQTAQAMARHASERQTLVARNVANADTPGYRALDMPSFAETLAAPQQGTSLRATRPGHVTDGMNAAGQISAIDAGVEASPNGNTVSIEDEMVKAAELRQQHDMAMAIYGKARDILRASLGRGQ